MSWHVPQTPTVCFNLISLYLVWPALWRKACLFPPLPLYWLRFSPQTDLSWLNWCVTGSCLFSLVLVLFFRESYDRLYLDVFVSV
ncbi:hypothetical protein CHARACLAT_017792 [Characodon lateralis]|uniref:Uncharacterized protein n=1 Tax=Characodon lateralis TaxID=208331 RepID=A0ABU7EAK7_9TELE|nr:hypothetical protein [Characodon lateralis]